MPLRRHVERRLAGVSALDRDSDRPADLKRIQPTAPEAPDDIRLGDGVFGDLVVDPFRHEFEEAKHGGGSFLSLSWSREGTRETRFGACSNFQPS